jgi:YLP motif
MLDIHLKIFNQQLELAVENAPADVPAVENEYLPPAVQADYLPPKEEELKEYLPPVLRKRAVRKIYRRIK